MYKKNIITILIVFIYFTCPLISSANNEAEQPLRLVWPFEGIFGSFDRQANE